MTLHYLNNQIKQLYNVTDEDYVAWCNEKKKPVSYKTTVSDFVYRLRTGRLVKDSTGKLIVKKPRNSR